uniref:Inner centromere protein n=1 Tax=Timema poppense TaxID=170557 RepID=A0A7R9GXZ6_TIMPO|nr:unnamed protein product [Timema poppensis]
MLKSMLRENLENLHKEVSVHIENASKCTQDMDSWLEEVIQEIDSLTNGKQILLPKTPIKRHRRKGYIATIQENVEEDQQTDTQNSSLCSEMSTVSLTPLRVRRNAATDAKMKIKVMADLKLNGKLRGSTRGTSLCKNTYKINEQKSEVAQSADPSPSLVKSVGLNGRSSRKKLSRSCAKSCLTIHSTRTTLSSRVTRSVRATCSTRATRSTRATCSTRATHSTRTTRSTRATHSTRTTRSKRVSSILVTSTQNLTNSEEENNDTDQVEMAYPSAITPNSQKINSGECVIFSSESSKPTLSSAAKSFVHYENNLQENNVSTCDKPTVTENTGKYENLVNLASSERLQTVESRIGPESQKVDIDEGSLKSNLISESIIEKRLPNVSSVSQKSSSKRSLEDPINVEETIAKKPHNEQQPFSGIEDNLLIESNVKCGQAIASNLVEMKVIDSKLPINIVKSSLQDNIIKAVSSSKQDKKEIGLENVNTEGLQRSCLDTQVQEVDSNILGKNTVSMDVDHTRNKKHIKNTIMPFQENNIVRNIKKSKKTLPVKAAEPIRVGLDVLSDISNIVSPQNQSFKSLNNSNHTTTSSLEQRYHLKNFSVVLKDINNPNLFHKSKCTNSDMNLGKVLNDCVTSTPPNKIEPFQEFKMSISEAVLLKTNSGNLPLQKSPLIFNPYAKESVKKRVAAYEQLKVVQEDDTVKQVSPQQPVRVTRTKARALAAAAANVTDGNIELSKKMPINEPTESSQKIDNIVTHVNSFLPKAALKPSVDVLNVRREEGLRRRLEDKENAIEKKKIILNKITEAKRRNNEEKMLKVLQKREARDREQQERNQRLEREREEKLQRAAQEKEEKLREEATRKKLLTQQKAAEIEERRRQEEAARLAKLREQEEEQARLAAIRKKEQLEAEKQRIKRITEEKETSLIREQEKQVKHKMKHILAKNKLQHTENTIMNMTFEVKKERHPAIPETNDVQHYPICNSGDSSEGEQVPKHPVPRWAKYASVNMQQQQLIGPPDVTVNMHQQQPDESVNIQQQ